MGSLIGLEDLSAILGRHLRVYRWRKPLYQLAMLNALSAMWDSQCRSVLDLGGGTGVIAQAIRELLPVDRVVSVDVEDRFLKTLTVETATFDGSRLPFPEQSFDCVVFNNVIHHVPVGQRVDLLRECRRVCRGPLFIKDHLAASSMDHFRLTALDAIGNMPFRGMIRAEYLSRYDWQQLAMRAEYRIDSSNSVQCREGLMERLFPNSLEIAMRWLPVAV